ncbi:hypothetical protein L917_18252 [Phytophthora nicotianae]|uniref:MULE transposase domain-containing protein n=1 Tax=Phytophthora nicotianae TaxID=4792 RepID=W2KA30_PHYNI|nr:hypothetical protein L917_18252 [Phytophthora nicotianae]ETM34610.1 hypothetical protein L914_18336 [Phytophthora nicotianae]
MENRELSMCEKVKTRKYTRLNQVSTKTLMKSMFGLESVVQGRITLLLRCKKVGFVIDAWTEEGTHFVAVIGVTGADRYRLCFSTLTGESDMGSDAIIELLDDVLDKYEIHEVRILMLLIPMYTCKY